MSTRQESKAGEEALITCADIECPGSGLFISSGRIYSCGNFRTQDMAIVTRASGGKASSEVGRQTLTVQRKTENSTDTTGIIKEKNMNIDCASCYSI